MRYRDGDPYQHPPRLPEGDEVDLAVFLAGSGPLELEIGPGRGAFLFERAAAAPEARLLGLEIRRKWACRVDERLGRDGLGARARVVCEDARSALPRLRPDACVARVFLHFPDPWWKQRHQKRLVLSEPLLEQIVRLLADGGELFVQTDVPERAERYRELLERAPALTPAGDAPGSPILAENPYGALSNRERRAALDGLPVYRLRYRRVARSVGGGDGSPSWQLKS
jgi:tRNA (guanine-N7-)-methyltransferase